MRGVKITRTIFQDDSEKNITEVEKGTVRIEKRIGKYISVFLSQLKEGEEVYIFTEDNLEEFTKHFNDKIICAFMECIDTKKEEIELFKIINKLESDKEKLQRLNKKLSEQLSN